MIVGPVQVDLTRGRRLLQGALADKIKPSFSKRGTTCPIETVQGLLSRDGSRKKG